MDKIRTLTPTRNIILMLDQSIVNLHEKSRENTNLYRKSSYFKFYRSTGLLEKVIN